MVFTPWSTLKAVTSTSPITNSWIPPDDLERIAAYTKYEEIYWNDPRQFSLRVLEGEEPIYIPNARVVVDTTAHYFMKGLIVSGGSNETLNQKLKAFLDRELFYSRFHSAKHSGVARGDFVFHLTANPAKVDGTKLSLNSVDPSRVFPIYHDDIPDKLIGCHLIDVWKDPKTNQELVKKLTYRLVELEGNRRISREEGIYELHPTWWGPEPKLKRVLLPLALLDERITSIPVYWFKNIDWEGWPFGVSELKSFEGLLKAVSQGSTDVQGALSLEGLGVYATDGGRPVDDSGNETDWELSPGKVMEVPSGSYFRRVEGVSSITPATDQITYLERKLREGAALTDVALGNVDVKIAQSGIALALRFLPTLAKIEQRDLAAIGKLTQLFFDWKVWHQVFEFETLPGEVEISIGDKLPNNRVERLNELNNMIDRKVISAKFYREEMQKLGYEFPKDIEDQITKEQEAKIPPQFKDSNLDSNQSNNANRVNESNGTEVDPVK